MNYILLLLGSIAFLLIQLITAKGIKGFTLGQFISRNWPAFLLNIVIGVAIILSDLKIIDLLIQEYGSFTYAMIGISGHAIIKPILKAMVEGTDRTINSINKTKK